MTPIRRSGSAVSVSAWPGLIANARWAATTVASSATTPLAPIAIAYGIHRGVTEKPSGAMPTEVSAWANQPDSPLAAKQPATPAARPIKAVSASSIRRTCDGVAPIARISAISRRRAWIANAIVPASTKIAIPRVIPPLDATTATSSMRSNALGSPASAAAACRGSSAWASFPAAFAIPRVSALGFCPGSASTAIALKPAPRPDSCCARCSVRNAADWRWR